MTAIVGILCDKGIVIGADSSATFTAGQARTIEQSTEKLDIIAGNVILTGTGSIGLGQRFAAVTQKAWTDGVFKRSAIDAVKEVTKLAISDFAYTGAPKSGYAALLGFHTKGEFHLCEFGLLDLQPELKTKNLWYCSMGCTQYITDSFLGLMRQVFWKSGPPSVNEGVFATTWVLDHAIDVNAGGVNGPVRIAVLQKKNGEFKAEAVSDEELAEHRQNIDGAKKALRDHCLKLNKPDSDVPPVPKPS